jgi:hypothetical protein
MIAVGMSDNRPLYGAPGVNVKITLPAIKAFVRKFNKRHGKIESKLLPRNLDLRDGKDFGDKGNTHLGLTALNKLIRALCWQEMFHVQCSIFNVQVFEGAAIPLMQDKPASRTNRLAPKSYASI